MGSDRDQDQTSQNPIPLVPVTPIGKVITFDGKTLEARQPQIGNLVARCYGIGRTDRLFVVIGRQQHKLKTCPTTTLCALRPVITIEDNMVSYLGVNAFTHIVMCEEDGEWCDTFGVTMTHAPNCHYHWDGEPCLTKTIL